MPDTSYELQMFVDCLPGCLITSTDSMKKLIQKYGGQLQNHLIQKYGGQL